MNTIDLKFFTGCVASLTLLCSFVLCGCSGAENDISALECFAGSCDEENEKDHGGNHENNQDDNSDDEWDTNHEDSDDYTADNSGNGSSQPRESSNPLLCGNLWCGPNGDYSVNTGFDDDSKTSGIWIDFDDDDKGGTSVINVNRGTENCLGLCGNVYLDNTSYSSPYAGLYFNLVNAFHDGADISSWKGFCITYQAPELGPTIEFVHQQGEMVAPFVAYLDPTKNSANISWNELIQQQDEGKNSLDRDTFLSRVAAIKIFWTAPTTQSVTFKITSIGTYDSCPK